MPARYPGGDVKQAIGNSFLQLDLRALCIKVVVKLRKSLSTPSLSRVFIMREY